MKRISIILVCLLFMLSSCNVDSVSKEYKGTYKGTYTFISENRTKDGSVIIASNPVSTNGVLIFGVLPLENTAPGTYQTESTNTELISSALNVIGVSSSASETVQENIKNISVKCVFNSGVMELVVSYTVELVSSLGISTEIRIVEFTGTKQ